MKIISWFASVEIYFIFSHANFIQRTHSAGQKAARSIQLIVNNVGHHGVGAGRDDVAAAHISQIKDNEETGGDRIYADRGGINYRHETNHQDGANDTDGGPLN